MRGGGSGYQNSSPTSNLDRLLRSSWDSLLTSLPKCKTPPVLFFENLKQEPKAGLTLRQVLHCITNVNKKITSSFALKGFHIWMISEGVGLAVGKRFTGGGVDIGI